MLKSISNLLGSQQDKKPFAITPELIRSIIDEIEADPYAGLGAISKKAMLVDRLCALFRMHDCLSRGIPVTQARPILTEVAAEAAPPASNVTVKAAPPKRVTDQIDANAKPVEQKALAV
jgi:hypothetical protein